MCVFMFGTILEVTNSAFQKGMTFCRSIYVKKVMKLLAFIFEQPRTITCKTNHISLLLCVLAIFNTKLSKT